MHWEFQMGPNKVQDMYKNASKNMSHGEVLQWAIPQCTLKTVEGPNQSDVGPYG